METTREYKFKLDYVYDGDTIYGWVDQGFGTTTYKIVRMFGIQAPEVRNKNLIEKARGLMVRDWLIEELKDVDIVIKTYKDKTGKYGRVLAEVYANDEHLQTKMLARDLVKEYMK